MLVIWFVWESVVHCTIGSVKLDMWRLGIQKSVQESRCKSIGDLGGYMEEERQRTEAAFTPFCNSLDHITDASIRMCCLLLCYSKLLSPFPITSSIYIHLYATLHIKSYLLACVLTSQLAPLFPTLILHCNSFKFFISLLNTLILILG